jgi:SAM-dependent methyltransferase
MTIDHFGERVAATYDATSASMFQPDVVTTAVDRLVELAGDGAALELGVGTGRIALPLAARGVRVQGIDLSTAMVDRLRAKPGAEDVGLTIGDIATTHVAGEFAVVFVVFNTLTNLTTQEAQVACFANAAAHLAPGGRFVVEVFVPDLQRLPAGETVRPFEIADTHLGFDEYDVVGQGLVSHHWYLVDGGWQQWSVPFRYVWPAELDLMARLAGMTLEHRWADWDRRPFTTDSRSHVSVWRKQSG